LTGVFASLAVNELGVDGSIAQVGRQALAVVVTLVFSFAATLAILKLVDAIVGFRAAEAAEEEGIDLAEHGEVAYTWRERSHTSARVPDSMTEAELSAFRERLVLEATQRVLEAVRLDPTDERG
jgi:Amt family ammonium transporter